MVQIVCNRCGKPKKEGETWGCESLSLVTITNGNAPHEEKIDLCSECHLAFKQEQLKLNTKYATRRKRR